MNSSPENSGQKGAKTGRNQGERAEIRADEAPSRAGNASTDTKGKPPGRRLRLVRREGPGRAIRMTKHGYAVIEAGATNGVSKQGIAKRLGISYGAFGDILKRDPKAQDALDLGNAANEDELRDMLMDKAREGNVTAMIYLTKARHGWIEGQAPDNTPNITINLPPALSLDEYVRRTQITKEKCNGDT